MHLKPIVLVSYLLLLFSIDEPAKSFAFAKTISGMDNHVYGKYLMDNMYKVMNSRHKKLSMIKIKSLFHFRRQEI